MESIRGVAKTLLVPLACRAKETARPDALLKDPKAVEVLRKLSSDEDCLMGMSALDQTFTMMRARQFDRFALGFLASHPDALLVDIGCGLDTRFNRLDNGQMQWLGLDLPEVIALRQQVLPDEERCRSLVCSVFDAGWMDAAAGYHQPVIILAEGVFVYFSEDKVLPLLRSMAERFPGGELVFDALTSFSVWIHGRTSSVLKETGAQIRWAVDDPRALEACGLHFLERWGYFDEPEPRVGLARLMRYIPPLNKANTILRYKLGNASG